MPRVRVTASELKELRTSAGLSQPALAALVGVSPNTIARWERGELAMSPTSQVALRCVLTHSRRPKRQA